MKNLKSYLTEAICTFTTPYVVGASADPFIRDFNNLFSHTNVLLHKCPDCGCYYLQGEVLRSGWDGFLFGNASGNWNTCNDTPSAVRTIGRKITPMNYFSEHGFDLCHRDGTSLTCADIRCKDNYVSCLPAGDDIIIVVPFRDMLDMNGNPIPVDDNGMPVDNTDTDNTD